MITESEPVSTHLGSGYDEIKFRDLKQFIDYLYSDLLDFETYVWRGQRLETWKLLPTIERVNCNATAMSSQDRDFETRHLQKFKYAARGRRGINPAQIADDNDWWALGQHYGLSTPLLDWTTSPFVAAFFAFSEVGSDQTPYRAIYALHQPSIERMAKSVADQEDTRKQERKDELQKTNTQPGIIESAFLYSKSQPELVFVRPLSDENHRLVNQGGLFTRSGTSLPIEEWVGTHQPSENNDLILLKMLVPNEERDKCLKLLNRMNINPLSLFPDLAGASQHCNLSAEIENY
jgi:hypothetical protein